MTGYAVLAVLALAASWLLFAQSRFNPAVIVAMSHPQGKTAKAATQPVAESATAALLSPLDVLPGLAALSPVEVFDPETLSDKIDGKAELYLASGFQEMACRAFAAQDGERARVEAFVYAMASPKDAFAVFSGQRRPGADKLDLALNAYATENALFFTRDRYSVELVADRGGPQMRPLLEGMATALMTGLPAEKATGADSDIFPAEGLKADSVRLAVSDALGMQGLENVYTAEYALPKGEASAFLAVRESPEKARAQADEYLKFLDENGFKQTAPKDAPTGATVMALDTMVQVVMSRGKVLAGVHDAANPEAALELAKMLAAKLETAP